MLNENIQPTKLLVNGACGLMHSLSFAEEPELNPQKAREIIVKEVKRDDPAAEDLEVVTKDRPIYLFLLSELLRQAGNPDWRIVTEVSTVTSKAFLWASTPPVRVVRQLVRGK